MRIPERFGTHSGNLVSLITAFSYQYCGITADVKKDGNLLEVMFEEINLM